MSKLANVMWLSTSSGLQCFHQPLIDYFLQSVKMHSYSFCQYQDEGSCLDRAVLALYHHIKSKNRKFHLVGHGTAGLIGLLYSCRYPETVESLTLLSVGADAAVSWQYHYYEHRMYKSRAEILNAMVYNLFGYQDNRTIPMLERILEQELEYSLCPHSIYKRLSLRPARIAAPLMVCGSFDDMIVDGDALRAWQPYLKPEDRLWLCSQGKHFFHFFHPELVGTQVLNFWGSLQQSKSEFAQLSSMKVSI